MRLLLPLVALVALLFALPLAAAQQQLDPITGEPLCLIVFRPSPDFRSVEVQVDLVLNESQRAELARQVDADGDGTHTAAEVAAYETSTRDTLEGDLADKMLYMDGNPPGSLVTQTKLVNWTGETGVAQRGVVAEMRFYTMEPDPNEKDGHLLSGGLHARPATLGERRPVIETIVFSAPEGWVVYEVQHTQGYPDVNGTTPYPPVTPNAFLTPRERVVTISGFDIQQQYQVVFAREGADPYAVRGSGLPGPALATIALALAAAAWIVRRQR